MYRPLIRFASSNVGILLTAAFLSTPASAVEPDALLLSRPAPENFVVSGATRPAAAAKGGTSALEARLAALEAKPHALASADFDLDGLPDLAVAYAGQEGAIALFLGRFEGLRQRPPAQGSAAPPESPFEGPVALLATPSPRWLAAGDFDRDGLPDLVAAGDRPELWLFPGDGTGGFHSARVRPLPGVVTGLAAGEFRRRDGLPDLVVSVRGPKQSQALVLQSPKGAWWSETEAVPLETVSDALAGNPAVEAEEEESPHAWARTQPGFRAALQLRLDSDARPDALALFDDLPAPVAIRHRGGLILVVTSAAEGGDALPGDAICATGGGLCTFRAALEESNASGGMQTITFAIPGSPLILPTSQLVASDPVEIDGTTQAGGAVFIDDSAFVGLLCNISVAGGASVVRGLALTDACMELVGGGGNIVEGNFFGIDPTLTIPGSGSLKVQSDSNLVGGTAPGSRNFFVNGEVNVGGGLTVPLAFDNRILGNSFGVDETGSGTLGTASKVIIGSGSLGASGNDLGGAAAGEGNFIAGCIHPLICAAVSVVDTDTDDTLIQGNRIGTNGAGTASLPDTQGTGILVTDATGTLIGGTAPGAANVIAGNATGFAGIHGIFLSSAPTTGTRIEGNRIGTNLAGSIALGGYEDGVHIRHAGGNVIGGATAGAGNVISGNSDDGIHIEDISGGPAAGNTIQGNRIGTDASGSLPLTNGDDGIYIENAKDTVVGGAALEASNVIGGNGGDGIEIFGASSKGSIVQGNRRRHGPDLEHRSRQRKLRTAARRRRGDSHRWFRCR